MLEIELEKIQNCLEGKDHPKNEYGKYILERIKKCLEDHKLAATEATNLERERLAVLQKMSNIKAVIDQYVEDFIAMENRT